MLDRLRRHQGEIAVAAIAATRGLTLVTASAADLRASMGLEVQDWTRVPDGTVSRAYRLFHRFCVGLPVLIERRLVVSLL